MHAPMRARVRVAIVDDSLTVRTIFTRIVESDDNMIVAGTATDGQRALALIASTPVDVVLLDLEMPGMGGLEALPQILKAAPLAKVLVVSSSTQDGAQTTLKALSQGAADTLLKPRPGEFNKEYRNQLLCKIKALGRVESAQTAKTAPTDPSPAKDTSAAISHKSAPSSDRVSGASLFPSNSRWNKHPEVIAIGASTGGIHALNLMLRSITPACELPILITQHLPANFIPVFARQVEQASGRPTCLAEEGAEIRPGQIAIATGHAHLCINRRAGRLICGTSIEPAQSGCLPSVDPMLHSLAQSCEGRALGIILSGMGRDGLKGAQSLVGAGGTIWAQNAATSAVWGMPGAVAKAGLASLIANPQELGAAIIEQWGHPRNNAK